MAETVSLREYLDELDMMLENESPTEVVSHCRYILQHFPHNVETYRLLGKALLQKGQNEGIQEYFDEAAEVFLRVLSVLPNDHITHLGLSEIREHEDDLDRAIWHLERAYEQLPGNAVLQDALRDLYARRDGEDHVPEKIQLTRSGLARQFANNNLYEQALIELRAAIEHDPQRIDLQVLLAEILWESGHPVEAGEAAAQVLKKVPNSIAANSIMASLWLEYERPTDAQKFLDRLEALDPYEAARLIEPDADVPDPKRLARLDYSAKATAELSAETPSWVHDLDDFGESAAMEDLFLAPSDMDIDEPETSSGPDKIDTDAIFGMSYDSDEPGDWLGEAAESDVPDWFGGMNLGAGTEQEMPPVQPDWQAAEQGEKPDDAGQDDDVPDWFAEMAGLQPEEQTPPADDWLGQPGDMAQEDASYTPQAEDDLDALAADWLLGEDDAGESGAFGESQPAGTPDDALPDWAIEAEQGSLADDVLPPLEGASSDEPAPEALVPDWLMDDEHTGPETGGMAFGEEPAAGTGDDASTDDWLAALDAASEAAPDADVPDWMAQEPPSEELPESIFDAAEQAPGEAQGASDEDWLDSLREASDDGLLTLETGEEDVATWMAEDEPTPADAATDDDVARGFADYLSEIEDTDLAEDVAEPAGEVEPAAPEWLAPVDEVGEPAVEGAMPEETEPAPEEADDGAEAWPGVIEQEPEEADTPAAQAETEPDWWSALGDESPEREEAADDASTEDAADSDAEGAVDLDALRRASMPPPDLDLDELMGREMSDEEPVASAEPSPEWMTEPEYDFFAPAPQDEVPGVSQPDEDWLATFGEHGAAEAEDGGSEAAPEGLGWLETESGSADDDWLGSFALERAESDVAPEVEESHEAEQPAEAFDWQDDQPDLTEVEAAEPEIATGEEAATWLSEFDEAESQPQAASYPPVADEPAEQEIIADEEVAPWAPELEETESQPEAADYAPVDETPADREVAGVAEWSDADEVDEFPFGEGGEDALPIPSPETADPAWLADVEPIEAPGVSEIEDTGSEAFDSFALETDEEDAGYGSVGDTGVLQPDELPDWMMAFTGEDLPDDDLAGEPDAEAWDELSGEPVEPQPDEPQRVVESLADLDFEDAEYDAFEEDESGEEEDVLASLDAEPEAEEGVMPEWLMAITSSEADKLDDMLLDEAEPYSQTAEETGVLQPSTTPDWLMGISDTPETEEGLDEPEAELDEFAQPDDLAHTNGVESGSEMAAYEVEDQVAGSGLDEDAPVDFSFEDQPPAWLRRPKESDLASPQPAPQNRASEMPEWLRDVVEEDDESTE